MTMASGKMDKYEKTALDARFSIFSPQPTDISTQHENNVKFYPITKATSPGQLVEFNIPASSFQYTDFARCSLQFKVKIQTNSGGLITEANKVSLCAAPFLGLYRQVDVYLNQVCFNFNEKHNSLFIFIF